MYYLIMLLGILLAGSEDPTAVTVSWQALTVNVIGVAMFAWGVRCALQAQSHTAHHAGYDNSV